MGVMLLSYDLVPGVMTYSDDYCAQYVSTELFNTECLASKADDDGYHTGEDHWGSYGFSCSSGYPAPLGGSTHSLRFEYTT